MTAIGLEAENMTLNSGYVIKTRAFAENNQLIHLTELTGKATSPFAGTAGTYDVALTHYDESDGQATIKVTIGNNAPVTLTLDQDLTGSRPSVDNQIETTLFQGLAINPGDIIEITASMDNGETAAIDNIIFTPIILDTTAPTATLSAENFNVSLDSTNFYTFDVTFEDNEAVDISSLNGALTVEDNNGISQTISLVQVDNNSNGSPRVATYRLNAPGGSWDDNEAGTYTVSVADNIVTDTSGNTLPGGDLGTFDVTVSPPPERFQVEAEDFILGDNYFIEDGYDTNIVSGGELIAIEFQDQGDETGTADYIFEGESGPYNIVLTYFDETDGNGTLMVNLNDIVLDTWTFNDSLGNTKVAESNRVQRVIAKEIPSININNGDTFSLLGQRQQGESTRVDYVEFIPVTEEITDPSPEIDPPTISYNLSTQPILARLDQDFAIKLKYDEPIKIMPLGDSITAGKEDNTQLEADWEGYRRFLYKDLTEIGLNIDFVGSQVNGENDEFDRDNEGHRGWKVNDIAFGRDGEGGVDEWIPAADPDIVLLKIGTNDGGGSNAANNLDTKLIPKIFDNLSAEGELIVSTITPVNASRSDFATRSANIETYNAAIPGIVDKYNALGKNISFIDIQEEPNGITPDEMSPLSVDNGLHPTFAGYEKMANFYYQAILDAVGTKNTFSNLTNIVGSQFNDVIVGNDSDNEIRGGEGEDELTGGSGADQFVYETIDDGGDLLTDFNPAEGDVFRINTVSFGGGLQAGTPLSDGTSSSTGVFVSGSNPQVIGTSANFLYNTSTGVLSVDLDGIGNGNAVTLATLDGTPVLTVDQFEIV